MLLDNFERNLESFVLKTQNALKSARNQINSLNTSRNELMKFSVVFVFSNMLYGKIRKPENAGKQQKALQIENIHCQRWLLLKNCYKTTNLLSKYHLALTARKATFKLQ